MTPGCTGEPKDKIHADVVPRSRRYRKRGVKARILLRHLRLDTRLAVRYKVRYIPLHRWPVELALHCCDGLVAAKMPAKTTRVCFPREEVTKGCSGYTQPALAEKESVGHSVLSVLCRWPLLKGLHDLPEIGTVSVTISDRLESGDSRLDGRKEQHPVHLGIVMSPATESVGDSVVFALLMANDKDVILHILDPPSVAVTDLLLVVKILQCIVVREQNKLLREEVVAPVTSGLDDGVELLIVVRVSTLNIIQLMTEEFNRVPFLAKDTSNFDTGSVASDFEHAVEVGKRRTGAWVIRHLSRSNASSAAAVHSNGSRPTRSVMGAATPLKDGTNRR